MNETIKYTLPAYWASYLINGDASGLEPGEQEKIDAFLLKEGDPVVVSVGEQYFAHSNDATSLGGDVCDYVATFPLPIGDANLAEVRRQRDELLRRAQEMQAFIKTFPSQITEARLDSVQGKETNYNYRIHDRLLAPL